MTLLQYLTSRQYFQSTQANGIDNAADLFFSAYDQTVAVSQGKRVIVAETGWPTTGPTSGAAVASVQNAQTYWDEVACKLFQTTDTYWYILADAGASPSFGVSSSISNTTPLYNLTCPAAGAASSSSAMAASATSSVASSSSADTSAPAGTSASASASASATASASAPAASMASSGAASMAITQSAVPTAIGAGSPQAVQSASYDSAVASFMTAHPSSYSAVVASASAAASAASTMSLATSASGYVVGTASAATGTAGGAMSSHAVSGTAASSRAASGTAGASPAAFTGAAASNTVGALGGVIGAIFAVVALF